MLVNNYGRGHRPARAKIRLAAARPISVWVYFAFLFGIKREFLRKFNASDPRLLDAMLQAEGITNFLIRLNSRIDV